MKCSVEDCEDEVKHKDMCGKHYKRWWRHGNPLTNLGTRDKYKGLLCCVEDCGKVAADNCMCKIHAQRFRRYGRTHTIINRESGWSMNGNGYIVLSIIGKRIYEHIYIAEKALGKPLPHGAVVHHVNSEPWDNTPNNLIVCPNQAYHLLLHRRMKELGYGKNS